MQTLKRKTAVEPETAGTKKYVLLVDDHPLVREGIATLVRATQDLGVAGEAGTAAEALQVLAKGTVDVVLLDISLPGTSGIELLKDIRVRYPHVLVLVLSMHEEGVYAERALRAGAHGYIMKQEPGVKVVEALRAIIKGDLYVSPTLAARMLKLFVSDKNGKDGRTSIERLSDRELQVYTYIGNGLSTQTIATRLHLSVKTIQTYREHIKRKLGLLNATELVHHATHWVEHEKIEPVKRA